MTNFSPLMPLLVEISGKGFVGRKYATDGPGNSLFHNLLSRINEQAAGKWIPTYSDKASSRGNIEVRLDTSGITGDLHKLIDRGSMIPARQLPELHRLLVSMGFSKTEINRLMESMDRPQAGLQPFLQEETRTLETLVVDKSDIPRIQEALFKMGLGAGEVKDVMERAVDSDGHITLNLLTSALASHFSDVRPETGRQLVRILERESGIVFRAGNLEQAAKDAGLDQALTHIKGNSSDAVREAAKIDIASIMSAKGIPSHEIKQFLETLTSKWTSKKGAETSLSCPDRVSNDLLIERSDIGIIQEALFKMGLGAGEVKDVMERSVNNDGRMTLGRLTAAVGAHFPTEPLEAGGKPFEIDRRAWGTNFPAGKDSVLDRADIPRIQEALFKMGLGAGEVKDVMERSMNNDGRMTLGRLTAAVGAHFLKEPLEAGGKAFEMDWRAWGTNFPAGKDSVLDRADIPRIQEALFKMEPGAGFTSGNLARAAKDADLDKTLDRLGGNTSGPVREAAKIEIASLMSTKGIPAREVKKFLESLVVKGVENRGPTGIINGRGVVDSKIGEPVLRNGASMNARMMNEGKDREKGSWKERIIDILGREEFLTGRKPGSAAVHSQGSGSAKTSEMLENGLFRRNEPDTPQFKAEKPSATGPDRAKAKMNPSVETIPQTAGFESKAGRVRSSEESGPPRLMPNGEIFVSRAERMEASREAASTVRSPSPSAPLPEPLPKILDRMVLMINQGEQASRIRISPPELGRLDLEIVIKQGHLHAHVNVENPMVREIIEANLQQLKQQLGNLGFTVERFDVSSGLDDRRFAEFQARNGGRRNRHGRGKKDEQQALMGADTVGRARNATGEFYRINVRV